MSITAKMVQELRGRTGAALMDCKKALQETGGDVEQAVDHLRKAGLKGAEKRADRETAEGRVRSYVSGDGTVGAMIALTSETDFVARTDEFGELAQELAAHVAEKNPDTPDSLLGHTLESRGGTVGDEIKSMSAKLGENMRVAKLTRFENLAGRVGGYIHHDGKSGALISLTTDRPAEQVDAFLRTLGMHVAAIQPVALTRDEIPAETVERERAVYMESEDVKAKPEDKREMIVKGKLEKFFKDSSLVDQPWVLDPKTSVQKTLAAELGPDAKIEAFVRFQLG